MTTDRVHDAFTGAERSHTFFHGHSYTANPIACAAALANLEIWDKEPVLERVAAIARLHSLGLDRFRDDRRFTNVRQIGSIAALDLASKETGYLAAVGPRLYHGFLSRNLLVRPLGNTIYIMPPYCSGANELGMVYQGIADVIDELP